MQERKNMTINPAVSSLLVKDENRKWLHKLTEDRWQMLSHELWLKYKMVVPLLIQLLEEEMKKYKLPTNIYTQLQH